MIVCRTRIHSWVMNAIGFANGFNHFLLFKVFRGRYQTEIGFLYLRKQKILLFSQ